MLKTTRYLILTLVASLMIAEANAASLSLVGVGDWSTPAVGNWATPSPTISSKMGLGGGVLIDGHLVSGVGLEIGALYISRQYELNATNGGGDDYSLSGKAIQIPLLLRFHLLPIVTVGFGGYIAYGVGNYSSTDNTNSSKSTDASYSATGVSKVDNGLLADVAIAVPLGMSGTRFRIDGRYAYGLTDVNDGIIGPGTVTGATGPITIKYRDVQVLAGFQFPFGHNR